MAGGALGEPTDAAFGLLLAIVQALSPACCFSGLTPHLSRAFSLFA